MTRLPYNTWDSRGPRWRRHRVHGVVAAVAAATLGLTTLTTTATPGRALEATADLDLLKQQRTAEDEQLHAEHERRVAGIFTGRAARIAGAEAARGADLAALAAAAADRLSRRDADKNAAIAAVEQSLAHGLQEVDAGAARRRTDVDAFFTQVLGSLGPEGTTPTRTQLETAKKDLESRRSSELAALAAAHQATEDKLSTQVKAAVAALDGELAAAAAAHSAAERSIAGAESQQVAQVDGDLRALLVQLERDLLVLKQRHAQERLLLEDVHDAQDRAARNASSGVRSSIDDRQHQEEDALKAQQALGLRDHSAAVTDAKLDADVARKAHQADAQAAEAVADATLASTKTQVTAVRDATATAGSAQLKALVTADEAAYAALKATYDAAVSGISKAHAGVRSAWTARLDRLVVEKSDMIKAVTDRTKVDRTRVEDVDVATRRGDASKHDGDVKARERAAAAEIGRTEREARAAVKAAGRDLARRQRLLQSEYWTLRLRAVAFAEDTAAFSSVGAAFDPATDPGSLWNVSRAIGALEVDGTGAGVDIAHIDTGIVDVPGLAEADVEIGPDFSFDDAVDAVRNRDGHGHGTHLASIMVARDAAWNAGDKKRTPERFLGVAPDAGLVSIKAGAADGGVDVSQVIAAINWVIRNKTTEGRNIRVLTLAFGTDGGQDYRLDPLAHAVERAWHAGIVVVVSGGNDGWDASRLSNPAQDPYVLAVGAAQLVDGKTYVPSSFSEGSLAGRTVDLSAPGRSIVALRSPGSLSDGENQAGRVGERFVRGSGTSQSAAVVAGAAALLVSERPLLTPDQVKHLLTSTAQRPASDDASLAGAGYLRVDKAVDASTPAVRQTWQRSTGTGSLDGARGSVRIGRDGVVLEGPFDVFGHDWSASAWSQDAWTSSEWLGARWKDAGWLGARWKDAGWEGARWKDAGWEGARWKGTGWDGARWKEEAWDGARWKDGSWDSELWAGARWKGARWHAGGWFGSVWSDGPGQTAVVGQEAVSPEAQAAATTTTTP